MGFSGTLSARSSEREQKSHMLKSGFIVLGRKERGFQNNEKVFGYTVMFYRINNSYRIIVLNNLEFYNSPFTKGVESHNRPLLPL